VILEEDASGFELDTSDKKEEKKKRRKIFVKLLTQLEINYVFRLS
jgi:hypothetical protein